MQSIWYRKGEAAWFLTIRENGRQKQLRLLRGPNNRDARKKAEGLAIQELATRKIDPTPATPTWITVGEVLDGFLRHSKENHEPSTYEWYEYHFESFKKKFANVRIRLLKKHHIQAWLKDRRFSDTSANRGIGAIKRAFAWALEEEYIARNPIEHVRKPTAQVRDRILTLDRMTLAPMQASSRPPPNSKPLNNACHVLSTEAGSCRQREYASSTASSFQRLKRAVSIG